MELLLIPFLLISGTTLIYLGVHGVPAAPWLQSVSAGSSRGDSAKVPGRRPEAPAKEAQARDFGAVEPADRALESGEVASFRQTRQSSKTSAEGPVANTRDRETDAERAVETAGPDGQDETVAPAQPELTGNAGPAPEIDKRASLDIAKEEALDDTDRIGPATTFNEADALFGEVLMEMSLVRNELQHLHKRVETLSSKQPAITRVPGGPRRRRLRRIGGF